MSKARKREDLTQEQAAIKAGIHPTTIGKIETGDRGMSITTFAKLSYIYDDGFVWEVLDHYASE